jgi:hypothetical protein
MTSQQAEAFAQVRKLAAAARFRVRPDAEGWPVIPGRLGLIEWYCDGRDCHSCPLTAGPGLAVCTDRPRLFPRLRVLPGLRCWQSGDREMWAAFRPEALTLVARAIRSRRRATRLMTPARLAGPGGSPREAPGGLSQSDSAAPGPRRRRDLGLESCAGPEASA